MTDIMKLIERLRTDAIFDETTLGNEAADAIEALQGECAEHKENAIRNARQAVAFRAERDALQANLDEQQRQEPIGCGYVVKWERGTTPSTYETGHAQVLGVPVFAAPKALEPLTAKEDWDVRGILASRLRVFHRATEAEVDELISLFAYMKSRTPLTQPEVVEAFCNTRHNIKYVSVFDAGVRFAEKHHGITKGTPC